MNVIQSIALTWMAWGCALPTCFMPDTKYTNITGMIVFIVGAVMFICGSEERK